MDDKIELAALPTKDVVSEDDYYIIYDSEAVSPAAKTKKANVKAIERRNVARMVGLSAILSII